MNKTKPRNSNGKTAANKMTETTNISPSKLKVLCFHGYRQNADSFKSKLGSFRKYVNKYAEFVFITAPHVAPPFDEQESNEKQDDLRSWWFNKDDGSFKGTNKNGPAFGFDESLQLAEKVWREQGPFQGLLGFSQGACFVGLLCSLSKRGMTEIKPNFAILSSGFLSGSLVHLNYYEETISLPSLHIFGESDDIIPKQMSELLASTFVNPQIITHPGGHYFPATTKEKHIFISYFQDLLQEYLEAKEIENANETNTIELNNESDSS